MAVPLPGCADAEYTTFPAESFTYSDTGAVGASLNQ